MREIHLSSLKVRRLLGKGEEKSSPSGRMEARENIGKETKTKGARKGENYYDVSLGGIRRNRVTGAEIKNDPQKKEHL